MNRRWLRIFLIVDFVIFTPILVAIAWWVATALPATADAYNYTRSDDVVRVSDAGNTLVFEPIQDKSEVGFIFFPGAKVNFDAYAPVMYRVAESGHTAIALDVPLNFAFAATNAPNAIIDQYPNIEHWVISGHSLGGVAAAVYVTNNDTVDGLIFLASYPANDALADRDIAVVSIYGTLDGLTSLEDIENSRALLPADSIFIPIEGGNHAQFGAYGEQNGDLPATISAEAQWDQTADGIIDLLDMLETE